jgi:ribonuclease HI
VTLTQKIQTLLLRKLLDEERGKVTLLWVPGHMRIPGNEIADKEATATLEDDLLATKNTHHKI